MKILTVLAFCFALLHTKIQARPSEIIADSLTVKGFLKAKNNSQPIISANISVKNAGLKTKSDTKGSFRFTPQRSVLQKNPTLLFSAPGFDAAEGEIDSKYLKDLKIKELNIGIVFLEKQDDDKEEYSSLSSWLFAKARSAVRSIIK